MDDASSSSYFHRHHLPQNPNQPQETLAFSSNLNPHSSSSAAAAGDPPSSAMFPHSVAGRPSAAPEPVKRKRGRPRKYGVSPSSSSLSISPPPPRPSSILNPHSSSRSKKDQLSSHSSKKPQPPALGNAGKGFTPHVIMVAAGEDVAQNIMSFVQQHKRAVCILSASGSISEVSLCQPAMIGVNVAYEGRFDIISLSGSFMHIETGGASTVNGRLNICISGADGRIVGGGVGGPLIAACPVQVIVGSFSIDPGKNTSASSSMVNAGSKMSAPVLAGSTSTSPAPLRTFQDSLGRMTPSEGSDDNPSFGGQGNSYMFHSQGMSMAPSRLPADWRGGPHSEHGRACLSADEEDEVDFRN